MGQGETGKVQGVHAGPVRLTPLGAALLALVVAVPGGVIIWLGQVIWLWFLT
jgi:hypothetical protein